MILCDANFARRVDRGVFPGTQGGPLMHVIAGKAVMLKEAATSEFRAYAQQTVENAKTLAETLADGGLRLVGGGTETHLVLVDVRPKELNGQEAAGLLERCGVVVNKNAIPFDELPPALASGIRIGTPALTSRGFGPGEIRRVGQIILEAFDARGDVEVERRLRTEVRELCDAHPAPGVPSGR
jgi:glycine hydroxymethyltransferase